MTFAAAYAFVRRWEGGLVDHPNDPGGLTKWGVTLRAIIAKGLDFNNDGVVNRKDILDMTPEQASQVYRADYWDACQCNELPYAIGLPVFDSAVNQGPGRAKTLLQKALGTAVDGIIGPVTVEATWAHDREILLRDFMARRAMHYSSLANMVHFGLGWFRRLFDCHRVALIHVDNEPVASAAPRPAPPPEPPKRKSLFDRIFDW